MSKPSLLIIGGGFAGVTLAQKASTFADVTLVDPKSYLEITWATVRSIVDSNVASRAVLGYKDIPNIGRVVQATVTQLSSKEATLSNGETLAFDYAAICTGSSYSDAFKSSGANTKEQRLQELNAINETIKGAKAIAVVGGGPAGVEAAAEIVEAYAGKKVTLVHPGKQLLSTLPPKAGATALKWLQAHGVEVLLETRVSSSPGAPSAATLELSSGNKLAVDLVLWCAGAQPNTSFLSGDLAAALDDKKLIKVAPTLQVEGAPHIFALGDCNNVPEFKQGYLAVKHAELAAGSIKALIQAAGKSSPRLKEWKPNMGKEMMIVSLGRGDGVCRMGSSVCGGCLPANIKSKGLFVDNTRSQMGVKN
ncbi:NADH dehydrogenase [Gonium pectorale]|uniref:NADH dehydrogenase n=1 Tax=Gonium pectorale TaxID=33097 RepID=A0A150GU97_GONPE|nr:NADH dehydrogenase [Gonium pectorale]|eukprot:KXZ53435.1 NADH dehydrogenase [Gonium pectorale]